VKHETLTHIKSFQSGAVIHLQEVYSYIYKHFPEKCDDLGFMGQQRVEPRWRNEVRQAFHLAEYQRLIVHLGEGKTEEYKRL
jgi:hypothetical protein